MLTKFVEEKETWGEYIDTCLFAYNTSWHESTIFPPFDLLIGHRAYLQVDVNVENCSAEEQLEKWQQSKEYLLKLLRSSLLSIRGLYEKLRLRFWKLERSRSFILTLNMLNHVFLC